MTAHLRVAELDAIAPSTMDGESWRGRHHRAGRTLLHDLLTRFTDAGTAAITVTDTGQPRLDGHPRIGLSVSHSDNLVAGAIGVGLRVGVDVQTLIDPAPGMVRRCVHGDPSALERLPRGGRGREFTRIWAVQEACVKALGRGLSASPWEIPVPVGRTHGRWRGLWWTSWQTTDAVVACALGAWPAAWTEDS
jgi:4'-phosphopantetheinyl transferase